MNEHEVTPEELKEFRLEQGWSQSKMALNLYTTKARVSDWERGKHRMTRPYVELFNQLKNKK